MIKKKTKKTLGEWYSEIEKEFPHLKEEETARVAQNAYEGNMVPVPRTGLSFDKMYGKGFTIGWTTGLM